MSVDAQRGGRLREERDRLGWSQQQMADAVEIRREMWAKYEAGAEPGASVLARAAGRGVDVQYLLIGVRSAAALPVEEQRLLALFRLAEPNVRQAVVAALAVGSAPQPVTYTEPAANSAQALLTAEAAPAKPVRIRRGAMSVEIHGGVGQHIEGGSHAGATFSVDMGAGKKPKQ